MILLIISIVLTVVLIIYFAISMRYKYFSRHGVMGPKPKFFYGNIKDAYEGKHNVVYDIDHIYSHYKGKAPFVGFFMLFTPYFLILDPELIKAILIQKFKHFRNNDFTTTKAKDPLMSRNPFMAKDDEWKQLRSQTAPALTTNKLKVMFPLVTDGAQKMVNYINENDEKVFEARDLTYRFSCDVVSDCVLAFDAKSFSSENPEILKLCKNMFNGITESIQSIFPKKLIPKELERSFIELMLDAINCRIEGKKDRDDFLAHIIATKQRKEQSDVEAAAHGWTFFLDAFETVGVVSSLALYELANSKRVQDKLREEIMENLNENDGTLSYEQLLEMPYLDQVFNEILRLRPPFMFTTKVCSEDIELESVKGHKFPMKKGSTALISMYSVHRDPEYYPDPNNFNPERFDPEHGGVKSFRDRCVLLPFGDGPRICLGMKLGILMVKTMIAETLKNFEITINEATDTKWKISLTEFLNVPESKILLNFKSI